MMDRRDFLDLVTRSGIALALPAAGWLPGCADPEPAVPSPGFRSLVEDLLRDWCDGLVRTQVLRPEDTFVHGLFECPACDVHHARGMDAVYPLLYMAKVTGQEKYLEAGIAAIEWAEHNVSQADGSWTNTRDPKFWNGTTVFGAISLAEALHHHGDLLTAERQTSWTNRLRRATEFAYNRFPTIDETNVNYGITTIYLLHLSGKLLDEPRYRERARALAEQAKTYFTQPNYLLYGEVKPTVDKRSAKGLPGVDLGYNVEESLNSLVLYAVEEQDEALLEVLTTSLSAHLEFMLPDGGWDNGWGTRMYKWTYWGSRTCDGSQPGYALLAGRNPAFGTAVVRNTELLRRCTHDGLLHGGIHYAPHGIKPCVHHTFTHAKPLAFLLDNWERLPEITGEAPLPRTVADGVRHFTELDVTLFARGDWRGTVSAYDAIYKDGDYRQATGGALSLLYHRKVGLLCAASMPIYRLVERLNQQPNPGADSALTPRVETFVDGTWCTNLFDRTATLSSEDRTEIIEVRAAARLVSEKNEPVPGTAAAVELSYRCSTDALQLTATIGGVLPERTAFVLPLLSPTGEEVVQTDPTTITVRKPGGSVVLTGTVPLIIKETPRERVFNMVPGAEALPVLAYFEAADPSVTITITVV